MFETITRRLRETLGCPVARHVPLAPLNTFGIGGAAACLVAPDTPQDVATTLGLCREEGVPVYVLGAGSNIIVPDAGVAGVVLHLAAGLTAISLDAGCIIAQAGVRDQALAEFAWRNGLAGFEWIFDIPGSVGGAVYMNAGNNDGEISHSVISVDWMDGLGRLHTTAAADLGLGYRTSRFQQQKGLVLSARFAPQGTDDHQAIRGRMDAIRALRLSKFPEETLCAGSIFKRPPGHYAGRLIEEAGCGGMTVGGALVSHKHKGFIVNTGGATASNVLELIAAVKERVFANSGVRLTTEVEEFAPFLD
jgi:UDP-N-acetylmuramate dehydrogenase